MRSFLFASLLLASSAARADTWVSSLAEVNQQPGFLPGSLGLQTLCNSPTGACSGFFELTPRQSSGNFGQILTYSTQGAAQHGVLKSYATASTFNTPGFIPPNLPGRSMPGKIYVAGAASFSDQWTITGGTPGTQGSMQLLFNMTGTFSTSGTGLLAAYAQLLGLDGRWNGIYNVEHALLPGLIVLTSGQSQNGLMGITIPIIFGTPKEFTVQMQSQVHLQSTQLGVPFPVFASGTADTMHTVVLNGVVVRNSVGNVIPYQLATQSGSSAYDNLGQSPLLTAAPEPATFGVMAAALGGLFLFSRRRTAKRV